MFLIIGKRLTCMFRDPGAIEQNLPRLEPEKPIKALLKTSNKFYCRVRLTPTYNIAICSNECNITDDFPRKS